MSYIIILYGRRGRGKELSWTRTRRFRAVAAEISPIVSRGFSNRQGRVSPGITTAPVGSSVQAGTRRNSDR